MKISSAVKNFNLHIFVSFYQERIVGFHVMGPNAGEITQGYAVAMRLNATKADFDSTIGIHPTCSEVSMTVYEITYQCFVQIQAGWSVEKICINKSDF